MRHARSRACASVEGFQSGSKSSTRLAPVKFTPKPPTFVVSRNTNTPRSSSLNSSISVMRDAIDVLPSMRLYEYPALATAPSMMSSICCVCENTRHRWPCSRHADKIFNVTWSLPLRDGSPYSALAACARRSSKSGWLTIFRSTSIPPRASREPSRISSTSRLAKYARYASLCSLVIGQNNTCSVFAGNLTSTSHFMRRSK
mmetsp:Transcript_7893/g.29093  ORF Transcript_7893/g.29093 Transcript_7893/m.29093 type:complete len:201 (+) Transcript_7893:1226-1828(+)